MASVNRATLIGNIGKDPEVRYSPSGMAICNLSLATSTKRKDKATGEYVEVTQWHRITFYDKKAEVVGQYAKKGKSLYVEGRIEYSKYTDKDGIERNSTDIIADDFQFLGSRDDAAPAPERRPPPRSAPPAKAATDWPDDDDIKF